MMNAVLTPFQTTSKAGAGWFMPPELTPLFHTAVFAELSEEARLTYNHLHGLYFHEQIIFFEQTIICPALAAVRKSCPDAGLCASIDEFISEENRHSVRFHVLLQQTARDMYVESPRYFIRNSRSEQAGLNWAVTHPRLFPMFLWLILILEERAMHCSRVFLTHEQDLAAPFFQVQRQHLADEVDHVQWDELVIETIWPSVPQGLRRLNVRAMDWMLREFIVAPKRAAVRVLDALVGQHPDLQPLLPRLKTELRDLGQTKAFQQSIFCAPVAPRSERLMTPYPEFDSFRSYWFHHER
jgi:hypothetical protein